VITTVSSDFGFTGLPYTDEPAPVAAPAIDENEEPVTEARQRPDGLEARFGKVGSVDLLFDKRSGKDEGAGIKRKAVLPLIGLILQRIELEQHARRLFGRDPA
jgi:hypothetical protein